MNENIDSVNNPYAPPTAVEVVAAPPSHGRFRSTKIFAWATIILIGSTSVAECLLEFMPRVEIDIELLQMIALVTVLLRLLGIMIYCVWVYRSAKNAIFFSGGRLSHSAGLAVGYYFIPFANFVKPIISMSEIYDKTYAIYRKKRPVIMLRLWWAAWITFILLARIYTGLDSADILGIFVALARGFACVGLILVVHTLTYRQHRIMSTPDLIGKIGGNTFIETYPSIVGIPMRKAALPPRRDERNSRDPAKF